MNLEREMYDLRQGLCNFGVSILVSVSEFNDALFESKCFFPKKLVF